MYVRSRTYSSTNSRMRSRFCPFRGENTNINRPAVRGKYSTYVRHLNSVDVACSAITAVKFSFIMWHYITSHYMTWHHIAHDIPHLYSSKPNNWCPQRLSYTHLSNLFIILLISTHVIILILIQILHSLPITSIILTLLILLILCMSLPFFLYLLFYLCLSLIYLFHLWK